jgi:hypothetical protein
MDKFKVSPGIVEQIRGLIAGLDEASFTELRVATRPGWASDSKIRYGIPCRESLNELETTLHSIAPAVLNGTTKDEVYELLVVLFFAINDRYMAGRSPLPPLE